MPSKNNLSCPPPRPGTPPQQPCKRPCIQPPHSANVSYLLPRIALPFPAWRTRCVLVSKRIVGVVVVILLLALAVTINLLRPPVRFGWSGSRWRYDNFGRSRWLRRFRIRETQPRQRLGSLVRSSFFLSSPVTGMCRPAQVLSLF